MEPQDLTNNKLLIKVPNYIFSEKIGDEFFILNSHDGEYYELSDSSSYIWEIIQKKETQLVDLISRLEEVFTISKERKIEILDFLGELEDCSLIILEK